MGALKGSARRVTLRVVMDPYLLCRSCDCFIKRIESACPFCGAAPPRSRAERARPPARLSRGQWVAFGSTLAAIGCSSPAPTGPTGQQHESTVAPEAGAGADDASSPDPDAAADKIACGTATCDRATQYCDQTAGACGSLPANCDGRATCDCVGALNWCSGPSTCAAVAPSVFSFTCTPSGSNGCYGSPPARPGWARR